MRSLALAALFALSLPALAEPAAVQACRAAHAGDSAAHIACLEAALAGQATTPARVERAPVDQAVASSPAPATETPAETPAQPAGLGAEQVKRANTPSEPVTVTIVSATYNREGLGTFRMADGQVWRETMPSPAHRRLKDDQTYTARLEEGRFGGYRMVVDGIRRMKTVQRLE